MGNSSSSGRGHHEDTVDFGYLTPQGVYTGARDWNQAIVTQLIIDRKLAPFYRPLEDYEDSWDDDQIIAAMKEPQQPDGAEGEASSLTRADSLHSASSRTHHKRPSAATKEPVRHPEAAVYRGAVDCPICFLYYPPNINRSRCCDQAICTECFVQIKRADPTTTHLVSEPASCPYCVQENFGVVYTPPSWRAGIGSEGSTPPTWSEVRGASSPEAAAKKRRKSFGADSPEVVTIDQIRPDWEAKLAAVRAAVARRANRRIIMRQVGDRLIPVGITSGRVHALPAEDIPEGGEGGGERGSRRRRRNQNSELNQYLGSMGLGGQDLEELMVMEAMRLSLIEHEDQQRRQREEEEKKKKAKGNTAAETTDTEGTGLSAATGNDASTGTRPTSVSSATGSSPGLLTPDGPASLPSTNYVHRSSSSISRSSGQPSSESFEGNRIQQSPSALGAIGTAIRAANLAASAVGSPSPEIGSSTDSTTATAPALPASNNVLGSNVPSLASVTRTDASTTSRIPLPSTGSHAQTEPESEAAVAGSSGRGVSPNPSHIHSLSSSSQTAVKAVDISSVSSPSINDHTAVPSPELTTLPLPRMEDDGDNDDNNDKFLRPMSARTASFASSLVSADTATSNGMYDYLPSSPASSASSLAHKPLLDQSPSFPPQGFNPNTTTAARGANNVGA